MKDIKERGKKEKKNHVTWKICIKKLIRHMKDEYACVVTFKSPI